MLMGGADFESVNAAVLIGNLPSVNTPTNASNIAPGTSSPSFVAANSRAYKFTIPAGQSYRLDDVVLQLQGYRTSGGANPDNPVVQILSDGGSTPNPANVLTTLGDAFSNNAVANPGQQYTFAPANPAFTFLPGTSYWLYVANAAPGASFGWVNSNPATNPSGIASFAASANLNAAGNWVTTNPNRPLFAINATLVPEPSAWLGVLAVMGIGAISLKRKI